MKLGQNFVKYLVRFWAMELQEKIIFEIFWPLVGTFPLRLSFICPSILNFSLGEYLTTGHANAQIAQKCRFGYEILSTVGQN